MDRLDRRPDLTNARRRPMRGAVTIVPISALDHNPVELIVVEGEDKYLVSAERGRLGKVWLTCGCAASISDGWCQHRIDLLCERFEAAPGANSKSCEAFRQIVGATALEQAGREADRSIIAFNKCLAAFDGGRPSHPIGRHLGKFTDLVSDLAACASELEDALGTLRRLLERA